MCLLSLSDWGNDMNLQIDYAPYVSWPLLAVFVALCAIVVGLMIARRMRGTLLRTAMAVLLLGALANPTIRQDERESLTDIAVAILDQSQSQSIGQRTAQSEKALGELKSRIAGLGNTELRVVNVHSGTTEGEDGTRLITALNKAVSDIPKERFAGAFLITDVKCMTFRKASTLCRNPFTPCSLEVNPKATAAL